MNPTMKNDKQLDQAGPVRTLTQPHAVPFACTSTTYQKRPLYQKRAPLYILLMTGFIAITSVFALGTSQPETTPPSKMGNHACFQDDATFATPVNQVSQLKSASKLVS